METVAIFGVGLIGGSFALALREAGFRGRIIGVSSDQTIATALALKVIDETLPAQEAASQADLLYLAQPIHTIISSLADLNAWVKPQAFITDAGSTKRAIVEHAGQVITRCQFLGGHPMAGRERRGVEAAEADLFRGRPYVLTPLSVVELDSPGARSFSEWLRRIGCIPVVMTPEVHDQTVAFTSHLPQLASTALAAMMESRPEPQTGVYGPALIDSTRLALSSFEIWGDIIDTNRHSMAQALDIYIAQLREFRGLLERGSLQRHFDAGARLAAKVRART